MRPTVLDDAMLDDVGHLKCLLDVMHAGDFDLDTQHR
jgi:hypothetical protein